MKTKIAQFKRKQGKNAPKTWKKERLFDALKSGRSINANF